MIIEPFVGIPYTGDKFCLRFASMLLSANGIPLPEVMRAADADGWRRVDHGNELDVVVFRRRWHVGVCIGRGRFIHCDEGGTSRIEYLSSPLWASRIDGFYRYEGCNGFDTATP